MKADERSERIDELSMVVARAKRELEELEPRRSFLELLQEELDEFDAEKAAGENWEDKAADLCELLVTGLNSIQSVFEGYVATPGGGEVNVSTAAGSISYDPDTDEWSFMDGRRG